MHISHLLWTAVLKKISVWIDRSVYTAISKCQLRFYHILSDNFSIYGYTALLPNGILLVVHFWGLSLYFHSLINSNDWYHMVLLWTLLWAMVLNWSTGWRCTDMDSCHAESDSANKFTCFILNPDTVHLIDIMWCVLVHVVLSVHLVKGLKYSKNIKLCILEVRGFRGNHWLMIFLLLCIIP